MAAKNNSLPERLLGVWAHPDDEAYLSAGFMAEVVENGGEVTVLVMTDGELGFADDDPRLFAGRSMLRRAEMHEAMATIGVTDVRFIGAPDGFVSRMDTTNLAGPILDVMREIRPDMTITFGRDGITGHDDHIATGLATTLAWLDSGSGELCYAAKTAALQEQWQAVHDRVGVWMTDELDQVDEKSIGILVQVAGPELERKREVLAAHASQTDSVVSAIGEADYRRWISEEAFRPPTNAELSLAVAA